MDAAGVYRFLACLFEGEYVELRALPSRRQAWVRYWDTQAVVDFIRAHAHEEVYFGVAGRRRPGDGSGANCGQLWALWVDLDFKSTPEPEARALVAQFPLPPSVVVRSGGGRHVYWLLKEAVDVPTEAVEVRALLRRLALALKGDIVSGEPARILRLPYTLNHKYDPARPVEVAHLDGMVRYNLSEFDALLPAEPQGGTRKFVVPALIPNGQRNNTLYRLARSMKLTGLSASALRLALHAENEARCQPPLPAHEVDMIARHAFEQPDR